MKRIQAMMGLLAVCACLLIGTSPGVRAQQPVTAFEVADEVARIAVEGELWPGFDPTAYPLAVYDGENTCLFHHPSPPEGFAPVAGRDGAFILPGRHETIRANTALDIGGVQTATVMLDMMLDMSLRAIAAVAVHELFHVYQEAQRVQWPSANEAELFTYPVTEEGILALQRLETEAFRRALLAEDAPTRRGWAQRALALRRERFALLPPGACEYERGNELIEGTAHYIQAKAERNPELMLIPPDGYSPERIRQRTYALGHALALLLDEFRQDWKRERIEGEWAPLDVLLHEVLAETAGEQPPDFTADERAEAKEAAQADAQAVVTKRAELKQSFLEAEGFAITVLAAGEPLWPRGFDPMNVQVLGGNEVLHMRWLRLGNEGASLEVLDRWVLTEGAGEHPLFGGVRRMTVRGLGGEPRLTVVEGKLRLETDGFTGEFAEAKVEKAGGGLVITLR